MYSKVALVDYLDGTLLVALLDALVEVFAHVHEIGVAATIGPCSLKHGLVTRCL